jgi:hypothetical protein
MQKDNEWRWHEGLDRDGSGRLGDVLVVYDQLTGSEMPELVAYRGGEQRSLAFAESLRATPLDTIVAPDGLTLRVERFDAFFPALHCTASWAGKTESITIRKSNRPFELGALYRMEIKGGPERTGMPWFELVVDRVADLPQ